MRATLPCRILIGPLSPTLELEGGSLLTASSLTHDLCLGAYLRHQELRAFYLHPELLLQPGQRARPLSPRSLCFGGPAGWSVQDLLTQARATGFEPELLIWWGFHYALPADIAAAPLPTLLIVSDWHYHYAAVRDYVAAFDYVLSDRLLEKTLKARGLTHCGYWPAYGFDPGMMREYPSPRDIDICFLGNSNPATYPERNRLLRRLSRLGQRHRVLIRSGVGHPDYARLLSRSKIVFNHALRGEMNLRAYEAAACGALLFQEADNLEISDYLPPGEASVAYTPDSLIHQLEYYLGHNDAREAIARRGQALIQDHSYERQFERLLDRLPDILAGLGPRSDRRAPGGIEARLLEARQLVTTDVPALRARALQQVESLRPQHQSDQAPPPGPLNALAVLRLDYQELLQTGRGSYQPLTSLPQVLAWLSQAAERGDSVSAANLAWCAFLLQDWQRLGRALHLLEPALQGLIPLDPEAFWLPLRFTPLHSLRQRLLQRRDAGTAIDAEWLRLLQGSAGFLAGNLALARQDLTTAAAAFATACERMPELAESWFERARCLQALGRPAEAASALASGLEQGVWYPGAWQALIQLLKALGRPAEATALQAEAAVLFQDPRYRGA